MKTIIILLSLFIASCTCTEKLPFKKMVVVDIEMDKNGYWYHCQSTDSVYIMSFWRQIKDYNLNDTVYPRIKGEYIRLMEVK